MKNHEVISVAPGSREQRVINARLKVLSYRSDDHSAGGRRFHVHGWFVDCETSLSSCSLGAWNQ